MRAKIVRKLGDKVAATITRTFTDAPSLFEFLDSQGIQIKFSDAVDDLNCEEVVYTTSVPLVEAVHEQ